MILNIFCGAVMTLATGVVAGGCTEDSPVTVRPETTPEESAPAYATGDFAKGADISWVTEFESQGEKFYTPGTHEAKELTRLLREDCGVNSIRLRVWVDPTEGWCNIPDVVVKARRAHELGMGVMIDFHFSDWWADPGQQNIPAAWEGMDIAQVCDAITKHVTETLTALGRYDIKPEWVQIGNETRTGMMWPLGHIDTGDNFTRMVNAGYDAVKAICPESIVIVHCDSGNDSWIFTRLFGKLKNENAKYDMIGMSLYPETHNWEQLVADCMANAKALTVTYGKPVMICEVGMDYREAETANKMLTKLMSECLKHDVKGIFWWEPETPVSNSYKKGCFNENGEPTEALDCFKNS